MSEESTSVSSSSTPARLKAPPRSFFWRICQIIATTYSNIVFDLKVYGTKNVPTRGGALLLANHQSNLDPVLISTKLKRPVSYMAKSELFEKGKYFTWLIRSLHAFPVKRGAGDVGAIKEAINRLNEGNILNMYPEGTRTKTGALGKILPGVAVVIRRAGVPVIPVIIDGSFDAMRKGSLLPRRCKIRIYYGEPLKIEGLKPAAVLELLDQTLHQMFDEAKRRRANEY